MIKAVLFDMDGLMLDTEKLSVRFWIEAGAAFGYTINPAHIHEIRSLPAYAAAPVLHGFFGEDFDYAEIKALRTKLFLDHVAAHGVEKKPGLDALLDFLTAEGFLTAVVTATGLDRTVYFLKTAGIDEKFTKIIAGNMVERGKPEPDIYRKAAEAAGVSPDECIAFEDSPNGVISAFRAGCKVVMVPDLTEPDDKILPLLSGLARNLTDAVDVVKEIVAASAQADAESAD
ncbi:MAG: HAD family phosphatase [Oscillospiraceae bacterium]